MRLIICSGITDLMKSTNHSYALSPISNHEVVSVASSSLETYYFDNGFAENLPPENAARIKFPENLKINTDNDIIIIVEFPSQKNPQLRFWLATPI